MGFSLTKTIHFWDTPVTKETPILIPCTEAFQSVYLKKGYTFANLKAFVFWMKLREGNRVLWDFGSAGSWFARFPRSNRSAFHFVKLKYIEILWEIQQYTISKITMFMAGISTILRDVRCLCQGSKQNYCNGSHFTLGSHPANVYEPYFTIISPGWWLGHPSEKY